MAAILDMCPPDVAADVLRRLDWSEAGPVLGRMTSRRAIGDLLLYQDDEAGGLMSPRVVALRDSWPAAHAINVLRYSELDPDELRQLFAVDENNVLVGYLDLPELVFAQPGATVSEVMSADVISVETGTDQEEAARLMARYELRSVPVVDNTGRLKGAIAIEDLVQVASEEATEDMYRMVGVRLEERETGRFLASVRGRLPWLTINLGTVLLAGWVLSLFQSTLDSLTILAVFLPVVMGQAGIAGTQTLTIIVRSIALGEFPTSEARGVLIMETALAIGQGIVVGAILVGIVWAWRGDSYLALVVAGALLLNMLVAALGGVLVPLGTPGRTDRPRHVISRVRHHAHRRFRHRAVPGARDGDVVGVEGGVGGHCWASGRPHPLLHKCRCAATWRRWILPVAVRGRLSAT